LQNLQREFPFKISLIDKKSTYEILEIIEKQNIEFILYSQLSENYKYEWPGAITFSYNYNIPLILPNEVANYYNLKGVINSNNNIIANIQNYYDNIEEYTKNLNVYKHQTYNRNQIVDKIVDGKLSYIDTEYGLIFGMENDIYIQNLKSKGYNNKNLVEFISNNISKDKDLIIDVGSYLGLGILGLLSKNMDARVISVEPQLHFAKLQKNMLLYNKYIDRVKIYNNAFGHKCQENVTMSSKLSELDSISNIRTKLDYNDKNVRNFGGLNLGIGGESVDMLSVDTLNTLNMSSMDNLKIIKIDVEGVEKLVIYGARKTIMEQKPIIIYRKTWKSLTQDIISMLKISNKILSFDIDTFLVNCGYDKKKVIKIDDHIIWQY
jgi:FkbM family methyltransferase